MLGAHGVKDLSTRYSMARLASSLSASGHSVLRMDLPGCGDSLGDWDTPGLTDQWLPAVIAASKHLQAWTGAQHTSLIGLRIGGLIGLQAAVALAEKGTPLANLALLAPVLQGRQHLRELRALSDGHPQLSVAGFPLSESTQQFLQSVDLSKLPAPPARRVFLGIQPVAKALDALAASWSEKAEVTASVYSDMAEHIGNPTLSRPPTDLFRSLEAWFDRDASLNERTAWAQSASSAPTRNLEVISSTLKGDEFIEEGVIIPAEVGLAGVWCVPGDRTPQTPVVVICNAGRNPHIGWARGSVELARRLARQGVSSLRFDLAGLGDSPPLPNPPAEILYDAVGITQLRAVIDHVRLLRGDECPIHLLGACSGGHLAFHEAVHDPRVAGIALVNVQKFVWEEGTSLLAAMRTGGKSVQAYRQRLFQAKTWLRLIKGDIDVVFIARKFWLRGVDHLRNKWLTLWPHDVASSSGPGTNDAGSSAHQDLCPDIAQGFRMLAQRGSRVLVVYGEEDGGRDEFAKYYGPRSDSFVRTPGHKLVILPDTDHDLTQKAARDKLLEEVLELCRSSS